MRFIVLFVFLFNSIYCSCQIQDSVDVGLRKKKLLISTTVVYTATLGSLYNLWYSDFDKSSFHSFNDNNEWQTMDKFGHAYSTYFSAVYGIKAFKWAGFEEKKAIWYGAAVGYTFLTTVEIFDGFSKKWGFSYGDVIANTLGTSLAIFQELKFNRQIATLKYSFQNSPYRKYRTDVLGENILQAAIKDYNGQTYWLSLNLSDVNHNFKNKWLSLAIGYGANGMVNAKGSYVHDSKIIKPYQQLYLGFDAKLSNIQTNKKGLKVLFQLLDFIKIPAPTIEFSKGNVKFHSLYF